MEIPEESWKRFDKMTDDDIDYSDDPPLTEEQRRQFKPVNYVERFSKKADGPMSHETVSIEVPKVLLPRIQKLLAEHMKSCGSVIREISLG